MRARFAYQPAFALVLLGALIQALTPFSQPIPCNCPPASPSNHYGSASPCPSGTEYDPLGPVLLALGLVYAAAAYVYRGRRRSRDGPPVVKSGV